MDNIQSLSYSWNSAAYIVTPVSPTGVPTRLLRNYIETEAYKI